MLKFFKYCNIIAAVLSAILFLGFLAVDGVNPLPLLALCAITIFNAIFFHKIDVVENDVIAIKKRLGMSEETTQDEAQNQSDNPPPPQQD